MECDKPAETAVSRVQCLLHTGAAAAAAAAAPSGCFTRRQAQLPANPSTTPATHQAARKYNTLDLPLSESSTLATMSGKEAYNNYEDEIDLYGDAEAPAEEQREQDRYGEEKRYRDDDNNDRGSGKNTSSIPTFISEARGGTGVLPPRDESGRSGSVGNSGGEQGSNGGSGGDGVLPRRGDYGSPGQWSTKPVSTVRPSDMPEEGLVAFPFSFFVFSLLAFSRFLVSLIDHVFSRRQPHAQPRFLLSVISSFSPQDS